jgi:uncharacterized repeat protein (TIGR03803 family)
MTPDGGSSGYGTVFELSRTSSGWREKLLYTFCTADCPQGSNPMAGLFLDANGNLFGTTHAGGANSSGTVFELSPASGGVWTETVLYSFCSQPNCADGSLPTSNVIVDPQGNVFGTTFLGGQGSCDGDSCGVTFELSPGNNGQWTETVLHTFTGGADGGGPIAGLTADSSGNLYGTTYLGGNNSSGVAFELVPDNGGWTQNVIYTFCSQTACADGSNPWAGVTVGADGNIYGTTAYGGHTASACRIGCGVVYRLTPDSGGWTEAVLQSFTGADGLNPFAGVVLDAQGNIFGANSGGGSTACSCGTVYELSPASGGGFQETTLHTFTGVQDGAQPYATLVLDPADHLYGDTTAGGSQGDGVVFELK